MQCIDDDCNDVPLYVDIGCCTNLLSNYLIENYYAQKYNNTKIQIFGLNVPNWRGGYIGLEEINMDETGTGTFGHIGSGLIAK